MTTQDAPVAAPAATSTERDVPRGVSGIELAVLVALVGLGAAIRAHGFTGLDLWYDDAWAAMPARVGLSRAVHMVLTAPGFGLALRSWVRLDPTTTWFGQLPAFVLGLIAIPAVFALLRSFRSPRWVALAGAALVTVSPVVVEYSTRLKEYPFDLLAACAILWLCERARRAPTSGRLAALAATCVASFFVSAGTAPVIAAVWLGLAVALGFDRSRRRAFAVWVTATALGCLVVWAAFLRHLPSVLSFNWRRRGYLVDYRSLPVFERSVSLIFGGFLHALTSYPVPARFYLSERGFHAPSVAVLGVALLAAAIGVPIVAAVRSRAVTSSTPAALTLLIALVLAAADRVPLGDGRTDEVLYPALLICLAAVVAAVTPTVRRAMGEGASSRTVGKVVAAALLIGAAHVGLTHQALYPTIGLRDVGARVLPLVRHGDVVFVDTFNSFGWCYYEVTPCRIKVGGTPPWPQGFRPVPVSSTARTARAADVFIARHNGIPLPEFTAAQARARRIWYVGYTYGTFDVGSNPARFDVPVTTFFTGLLHHDGWVPAPPRRGTTVVFGTHAYAELFIHPGRR